MNPKEEFQDYLYQIQNELLKNTSSPLYSHLLKDFMNDSDKFMSFYDFIMNSQEVYDFEIYKGLLGPLNSFGFYAEIGEVYNKMIKIVTEGGDKVDGKGHDLDKVDLDRDSTLNNATPNNTNTIQSSLFLVSLLDSHSSKFLRNLFSPSPSLSISLILFGVFLFQNKFFYESFKVLNVVSQGIPLVGYPPKEVMDKYWFIMGYFFLREGSYYSFMNCINKENYKRFGSKGDFKKILKIIKIKNEGNEFKKLLLKRKSGEVVEVWGWCNEDYKEGNDKGNKGDIKDDQGSKKEDKEDYPHTINIQSLINSLVPFSFWDLYFDSLDQEFDFKDFNFISFLKKNNLDFEIKENKIKIGKYKFKSISDKIYDIIEKYKEEDSRGDVKEGNRIYRDTTTPLKTSTTPSSKNTPLKKPTTPLKKPLFKDNFSLNKSKFKIYSLILLKSKKNFKMKNEILLKNRKNQFENLKIKEEEKRERLRNYYEIVKELIKEIKSNKENRDTTREVKDTTREFKDIKDHLYPNKPSKTNWRDLEVNDLQKTTYTGRQYRTKQREDDILSSRTISSFDRTEEESKGSKVYKPNMNINDLKILSKDGDKVDKEGKDDSSKGKYIPPHLRK